MNDDGGSWPSEADAMVRGLGKLPRDVAEAMRHVPRHRFVPAELRASAYADEPLPLGAGVPTISAPHMVAFQLEWAAVREGHRILEVGAGSGYLAALLAELAGPKGRIHAVEIEPDLAHRARATLAELGYADRVDYHVGNGIEGWPEAAPFDRILVSAAARAVAPAWREQLVSGGYLIVPLGGRFEQTMYRIRWLGGKEHSETGPAVRFVSLHDAERAIYRPVL